MVDCLDNDDGVQIVWPFNIFTDDLKANNITLNMFRVIGRESIELDISNVANLEIYDKLLYKCKEWFEKVQTIINETFNDECILYVKAPPNGITIHFDIDIHKFDIIPFETINMIHTDDNTKRYHFSLIISLNGRVNEMVADSISNRIIANIFNNPNSNNEKKSRAKALYDYPWALYKVRYINMIPAVIKVKDKFYGYSGVSVNNFETYDRINYLHEILTSSGIVIDPTKVMNHLIKIDPDKSMDQLLTEAVYNYPIDIFRKNIILGLRQIYI